MTQLYVDSRVRSFLSDEIRSIGLREKLTYPSPLPSTMSPYAWERVSKRAVTVLGCLSKFLLKTLYQEGYTLDNLGALKHFLFVVSPQVLFSGSERSFPSPGGPIDISDPPSSYPFGVQGRVSLTWCSAPHSHAFAEADTVQYYFSLLPGAGICRSKLLHNLEDRFFEDSLGRVEEFHLGDSERDEDLLNDVMKVLSSASWEKGLGLLLPLPSTVHDLVEVYSSMQWLLTHGILDGLDRYKDKTKLYLDTRNGLLAAFPWGLSTVFRSACNRYLSQHAPVLYAEGWRVDRVVVRPSTLDRFLYLKMPFYPREEETDAVD